MPLVQKLLVPPKVEEAHEYDEVQEGLEEDVEIESGTEDSEIKRMKPPKPDGNINLSGNAPKKQTHPEYEEFLHPNAMRDSNYGHDTLLAKPMSKSQFVRERKKKFNSCAACFKRFDDLIMRPLLIFNYEQELISKKEEFMELFMKEGDLWEKMFLQE